MKTVLILAAKFPPAGGVGVIRTLKFTKYLPAFGWKPIVVTLPIGEKHIQDDSLSQEIPPEAVVHRPNFTNYKKHLPKLFTKLFKPIEKRIYFPDNLIPWNKSAFNYIARHIIPEEKIDLIYTSVSPYSTMLLAHALKKKFHIPTFIDFRDPFSFNQYTLLENRKKFRKKAQEIEKIIFNNTDHINNVSRTWKKKYEALYPEITSKSSLIHNGYDEDDFTDLGNKKKNTTFTIGYNGTFSRVVPIEPLVSAISKIHRRYELRIRLSIATPIKKEKLAARHAYLFQHNLIDHKGFLPHKESLKNIFQTDVSALILNDIESTEGMLPAKTFEYLRIANPILLLHRKHSSLSKIVEKSNLGMTVNITDQNEIAQSILKLYEQWCQNSQAYQPDWKEIRKYERRELTRQLVDIFNTLSPYDRSDSP